MQLLGNSTGISSTLITYSIPTTAIKRMKSRGGNALGIDVEGHLISRSSETRWCQGILIAKQSIFSQWHGQAMLKIELHTLSWAASWRISKQPLKNSMFCTLLSTSTTRTRETMYSPAMVKRISSVWLRSKRVSIHLVSLRHLGCGADSSKCVEVLAWRVWGNSERRWQLVEADWTSVSFNLLGCIYIA